MLVFFPNERKVEKRELSSNGFVNTERSGTCENKLQSRLRCYIFTDFYSLMNFFEEFAPKLYFGNFRTIFRIDNVIVITFIGGFFDIG